MNILYLTDNPTLGGTIRILQSWLTLAPGERIRPFVVTPPGSKFLGWLADRGIPHTTCPMAWPNRRWPVPAVRQAWALARWARRRGVQVIHCNEHNVYPFATLLRRFLPRPLVCHVRYKVEPQFARWAFSGSKAPDALLWTSQQQKADCATAIAGVVPEERQQVLPLGLDLSTFGSAGSGRNATRTEWGFGPDDVLFGQACALRARKRVEEFIDLVAALHHKNPRVGGVLAGDAMPGDEPYREKVLQHIQRSGLGSRFRWLGNIDDVEPFDHAIDVFVSTSEYETFGNSVCEAMACGKPVIGYRGGSVAEVVGEAGAIVDNGDLPALTNSARTLLQQSEHRAELGAAGRRRVEEMFNPRISLQRLRDLYRGLLRTASEPLREVRVG